MPGELVGLANSSKVDPKLLPHPPAVTSRAVGSGQEQKSLFSTGIATTDALEAIAEKKEKGVFTPPESLPCGPGRLTGLPCNILIQLQYCPSGT